MKRSILVPVLLAAFLGPSENSTSYDVQLVANVIAAPPRQKVAVLLKSSPKNIILMAYNVENLFDTQHTEGKEDHAFLPIEQKRNAAHQEICNKIKSRNHRRECLDLDWSEEKLTEKLKRIAQVVLQMNEGQGPDILILEEVKNVEVLERLRLEYLTAASYGPSILIQGQDIRGINVGMLSRLPLITSPTLYNIDFNGPSNHWKSKAYTSRGVLRSDFLLPSNEPITVLGVHFPSPAHPSSARAQVFDKLMEIRSQLPPHRLVVAGGDFNVPSEEEEQKGLFQKQSKNWLVSHRVGCSDCLGTQFFNPTREWSFLDALLFSPSFKKDSNSTSDSSQTSGWSLDIQSIQVVKGLPIQTRRDGTPARFEGVSNPYGVSDHFPIAAQITYSVK